MKITITEKEYRAGKNMIVNFASELYELDSITADRENNIDYYADKIEAIKKFNDTINKTVTVNNKSINISINNGIDIDIDENLANDMIYMICNPAIMSIMCTLNNMVKSMKSIFTLTIRPAVENFKNKYLKDVKISVKDSNNESNSESE